MEPTYEGLKLRRCVFGAGQARRRLEPTYEGLKPSPYAARGLGSQCLEPTYEGLKPCGDRPSPRRYQKFGAYL